MHQPSVHEDVLSRSCFKHFDALCCCSWATNRRNVPIYSRVPCRTSNDVDSKRNWSFHCSSSEYQCTSEVTIPHSASSELLQWSESVYGSNTHLSCYICIKNIQSQHSLWNTRTDLIPTVAGTYSFRFVGQNGSPFDGINETFTCNQPQSRGGFFCFSDSIMKEYNRFSLCRGFPGRSLSNNRSRSFWDCSKCQRTFVSFFVIVLTIATGSTHQGKWSFEQSTTSTWSCNVQQKSQSCC